MRSQFFLSFLALLFALLVVQTTIAAEIEQDDFEDQLAAEAPELIEPSPSSFLTLSSFSEVEDPQLSFTELDEQLEEEGEQEDAVEEEGELETEDSTEQEESSEEEAEQPSSSSLLEESSSLLHNPNLPWHRSNKNQPVARHNAEIKCLDGDCTRAIGVKKAKIGDHPNQSTPPPPTKLDVALGAVKEEIMVRAKELHLEKDWSNKVAGLIDEYQQKLQKVNNNIILLRKQTKALLRKKKQIQNVQVQNKLRYKLQMAQADLNRLQKQMEHIAGKENEFSDTEKQLKSTMNALKNSLLKLRGQEPQKLVQEGIELP